MDTWDQTDSLRSKWSDLGVYTEETNGVDLRHPLCCVYPLRTFWLRVIEKLACNRFGQWRKCCAVWQCMRNLQQHWFLGPNSVTGGTVPACPPLLSHAGVKPKADVPGGHTTAASSSVLIPPQQVHHSAELQYTPFIKLSYTRLRWWSMALGMEMALSTRQAESLLSGVRRRNRK